MKTPHAILIGLTVIAAALFFREPSVSPAQAGVSGKVHGFQCGGRTCFILHGDSITEMHRHLSEGWWNPRTANFR